jgi:hypothetical protein
MSAHSSCNSIGFNDSHSLASTLEEGGCSDANNSASNNGNVNANAIYGLRAG